MPVERSPYDYFEYDATYPTYADYHPSIPHVKAPAGGPGARGGETSRTRGEATTDGDERGRLEGGENLRRHCAGFGPF